MRIITRLCGLFFVMPAFVILSKDPTAVDPETLDTLKVLMTIKEGTVVFALD